MKIIESGKMYGMGVNENMLETPEERIRLLKAGISARDIEKLYIIYNDFKIVGSPVLFESNNVDNKYLSKALRIRNNYLMMKSCKTCKF